MQSPRTTDVISKQDDPRPEEVEEQLSKILSSRSLAHSTVLQSFLRFVTEETVSGRAFQVSEYTIATQALGRGSDFDSSSDTIVRTQAYRLRQKLSDYYASEGLSDSIRIEIPKGHYIPSFTSRASPETPEEDLGPTPASVPPPEERNHPSPGRMRHSRWVLLPVLACGLALGFLLRLTPSAVSKVPPKPAALNGVDAFWRSFLQSDREPIIAYTNSLYLISNAGDQIAYSGGATGDRGTALDQVVTTCLKKNTL